MKLTNQIVCGGKLSELSVKKITTSLEEQLGAQASRDYDKEWLRFHVDMLLLSEGEIRRLHEMRRLASAPPTSPVPSTTLADEDYAARVELEAAAASPVVTADGYASEEF